MHPALITLGPFTLATYGVLVALGYLTGILWLKSQLRRMPGLDEEKFWTLIYALFFGAIAGGKLLYLAVSWREILEGSYSPWRDFRYGFVFYGGVLGAAAMGLWARRRLRLDYLRVADYFGVALPMGHAVGRLGCLAAGCCYGRPTAVPWAIVFGGAEGTSMPPAFWGVPVHPTQLYESAANLGICLFLLRYLLPRAQRRAVPAGTVFFAYIVLYSAARFVIELYRGDARGATFASLYVSQWLALAGMLGGGWMLLRGRKA